MMLSLQVSYNMTCESFDWDLQVKLVRILVVTGILRRGFRSNYVLPSRKLTWQWKITMFNRRYIFIHGWTFPLSFVRFPVIFSLPWTIITGIQLHPGCGEGHLHRRYQVQIAQMPRPSAIEAVPYNTIHDIFVQAQWAMGGRA